jgi:hypothetical protein
MTRGSGYVTPTTSVLPWITDAIPKLAFLNLIFHNIAASGNKRAKGLPK